MTPIVSSRPPALLQTAELPSTPSHREISPESLRIPRREIIVRTLALSRRRLLAGVPAVSLAAGLTSRRLPSISAQEATPQMPPLLPTAQWQFYGSDISGSRSIGSTLEAATASGLQQFWSLPVGGPVSATPVIADGVAYVGSYDGNLYAIELSTGKVPWIYATGAAVPEPNLGIPLGITGSAAIESGIVYVGDAGATVHAVDVASGQPVWTANVDDQESASIWSSPVVWNGVLYVGVASIAKEAGFRGSVVALDAASGETAWQTYMVPEGADGAGVFDVPAIDPDRNLVIVGTQNAYTESPAPYGNPTSVVALDATSGEMRWAFDAPPNDGTTAPVDDVAFSASPNLFSIDQDGGTLDLVGIGQKSGVYWALNRDTGAVVWQQQISPAGFLGGMEGTAAVSSGVIAVPATNWPNFDGPASGMVTALDAATGDILWTTEETAPAASPTSITNDVVLHAGLDGILHLFSLADGSEIWRNDLGASVSSGIAATDGYVVLGVGTPQFAPFVKTGNTIRGFILGIPSASPVASPVASPAVEVITVPTETPADTASPSPVAWGGPAERT
ncbi:MAG TPA: PQQ-binding-like beta-propeller repeat protein [Thermomicrobiales bacterium]|nr:PQQ-binding-like beta-propeller repeat protein [Thermomicrobiales bacterium]